MQLGNVQSLNLLLVHQYNVNPLLKLVDDVSLQIFVEGHEGITGSAPRRVHVDHHQLRVPFVEDAQEVVCVADR